MTNTYTLTTIEDVVEIATTLSRGWFRGHAITFGTLTPRIFRGEWDSIGNIRSNVELSLIESFKRKAPALATSIPKQDDHIAWFFLMQHHGAPTRLLDWTESALVALYFAVSEHPTDNGELWAMYPHELNKHSGFYGLPLLNNPILRYLAMEPMHTNPDKLAKELGLDSVPKSPIAIQPALYFPRIVTQLSTFTIHPKPKEGNTIPDLLSDKRHLVRYIVPKSSKEHLLEDLAALRVTARTLFPDLDHLSDTIVRDHHVVAYSPPAPPVCGGEWRSDAKEK